MTRRNEFGWRSAMVRFQSAWRTLLGIETVNMIRKGRVRWLAKGDAIGQARFIGELFGLAVA
jgi:hypothetical protein